MITVIGLGNEKGDLTRLGEEKIKNAAKSGDKILVRTAHTRAYGQVLDLKVEHETLDFVYEKSRNLTTLAKNLAKEVIKAGENAVYLVDGAATEDYSVKALLKALKGKVEVINGVSKISAIAQAANFKGCSYNALSAYDLYDKQKENLTLPLIVYDMDAPDLASDCKLILGNLFGDETKVKYIIAGKAKTVRLFELDRQKTYDYSSAVAIESCDLLKKTRFSLEDLQEIIVRLRKPNGCPWDRVQTNASIKMSAVEEAYELVDAIDTGDDEKIQEEAGDILMQAVFHAVLKEETGAFNLTDVLTGVCQKLITRHTHVFGNDHAKDDQGALSVWEKNKMVEKNQVTYADSVNDVPKCFPAAMRAQKVGKRAAKAGLDFVSVEDAAKRVEEELQEFFTAYQKGNATETEKELGDILFSVINVGRKAGCDCEKALKESVERFALRFTKAESLALADGKEVTSLSNEEWDKYYQKAKAEICG